MSPIPFDKLGTNDRCLSSCSFALWRLTDTVVRGPGVGDDPTFNEPGTMMLSAAEIYLATSCATIPFFWPVVKEQLNKIFVKYEFNVSVESNIPDEELELAHRGGFPASSGGDTASRDESQQTEAWSEGRKTSQAYKASYNDKFIQEQVVSYDPNERGLWKGTTSYAVSERPCSKS